MDDHALGHEQASDTAEIDMAEDNDTAEANMAEADAEDGVADDGVAEDGVAEHGVATRLHVLRATACLGFARLAAGRADGPADQREVRARGARVARRGAPARLGAPLALLLVGDALCLLGGVEVLDGVEGREGGGLAA